MISTAVSFGNTSGNSLGVVFGGSIKTGFGCGDLVSSDNVAIESSGTSSPVLKLENLKLSPDFLLSLGDSGEGSSWAVIDWHTSGESLGEVFVVPASLEDKDDDHDVKDGKSDKDETEYLSTSESTDESLMD